jgi:hypothetical protein
MMMKNPARAELEFNGLRPLENMTIGVSNQVEMGSKLAGMITKTL